MNEWEQMKPGVMLRFAAAKLERYERERAELRSKEVGWQVPVDPSAVSLVEALRNLSKRLDA